MTIEDLVPMLEKLFEISNSSSVASSLAKRLIQSEATTHNMEEIEKLVKEYDRNR